MQKEFIVRAYAEDNEVEYFSDKASINSFVVDYAGAGVAGGFVNWLDEYEGESGVIKVNYKSNHATDTGFFYSFIPRLKMENYHGKRLVIRAFIPTESDIAYMQLGSGINKSQIGVEKGIWKDYVFDYNVFETLWIEAENNPTLLLSEVGNYFAIFINQVGEGCIYIDKIVVEGDVEDIYTEDKDNGSNDIIFD